MADIRVKDLTEATVPGPDYYLLTDSATDGVKKVQTKNVVKPADIGGASLTGTETLTNKTLTAPVINSPTGIVKSDVGLGNVDNTSDATKNAASVALTNKTIDASVNSISNLATSMFAANVVDNDGTLAANSSTRIPTQAAVKAYADQVVAATDAMVFKGVIDCSANPNYPAADRGWTYKVSVAGKIGGASGLSVEVGDTAMCLTDGTASGDQATVGANWNIVQANLVGAVTGPSTSTNGNIATFSGTGGTVIQDGGKALPSGAVVGTSDTQALTNKTIDTATNTFKLNGASFGTATQATAALNALVGDSGSGGTKGLVPAPAAGDTAASKFLKADGTWAVPPTGSGGRPLLSADLNYYVRTDGSDSNNGLANTSGGAFLTVSAALAAAKLSDPNGHKIKINVGAGVFSSSSPNDLTGYFSKDIQIIGATPVSLTISSFGSASGSTRNWSVVINVTDASSVSVGDYAIIRSPVGTGAKEVHCGCWEVTAKTSTSVTLKNKYYGSTFPTNTLTGGTFTVIKTILKFTGCNGFQGGNFGKIDQVAIVGNNTAGSFGLLPADVSTDLTSSISLNLGPNVGVVGFDIGMVAHFGVSIHADSIVCSDFSTYGLSAQHGGTIFANNGTSSGGSNTTYNVMSQYGASIYFEGGLTLGGFRGVQAQLGGNILFKSGKALLCDNAGAGASFNGTVQAEFATLTNNRNYGGVAEDDGVLYADQASISSNDVNGLFVDGGKILTSSSDNTGNGSNALSCTNGGRIKAVGANLHGQNVFANKGAWVNLQGATNLGTLTPAANTLGNEQAYIDT